jgi:hypothetical protein
VDAKTLDSAAHIAMHRILTTDLSRPELACPGARRSAHIEAGAKIIIDVFSSIKEKEKETNYDHARPTYTGI